MAGSKWPTEISCPFRENQKQYQFVWLFKPMSHCLQTSDLHKPPCCWQCATCLPDHTTAECVKLLWWAKDKRSALVTRDSSITHGLLPWWPVQGERFTHTLTSEALRERRLSGWSKGGLLSCIFSRYPSGIRMSAGSDSRLLRSYKQTHIHLFF